uniref:MADS-box domain-containing protein n=1 Tax=Ditylenchus dipsaci TaxID=166011 RepID=A0A915D767_9BILA
MEKERKELACVLPPTPTIRLSWKEVKEQAEEGRQQQQPFPLYRHQMPRTSGVPPTKNRNSVACCSPSSASSPLNQQQEEGDTCPPFNLNFSNPGGGLHVLQDSFDSGMMMMLGNDEAECSEPTSKESTPLSLLPNGSIGLTGKNAKSTVSLLPNGKKTKGRVKIKMEYIGNKLRRYTTFSKRKTEQGKTLIQGCLSTPDENFPDMGAIKTEFTFEPPACSSAPNGQQQQCIASSSSSSRKRKLGQQGQAVVEAMESLLPTMVSSSLQVNSCSPLPKQEYMEEEEEDDEEDDEQEEYEEDFEEGRLLHLFTNQLMALNNLKSKSKKNLRLHLPPKK